MSEPFQDRMANGDGRPDADGKLAAAGGAMAAPMTPEPEGQAGSQANAVTFLEREHDQIEELFHRVSQPDEDRPAVLKVLIQTLAAHVAMEKQMVVPVLKAEDEEAGALLVEHHDRVEHVLTLLERRKVNSPDVPELVTQLIDLTATHITDSRQVVEPALRRVLSEGELDDLGSRMASDERRLLTHSHPHLPDSGPVATVTRGLAAVVDGVRDRSPDIGRTST